MTNEPNYDNLREMHNIACSAAHSLKCIDQFLEAVNCDQLGFTYEDAAACSYNIKRAVHLLSEIPRVQGLKTDPLYPEWGKPLSAFMGNGND
jgi:hypothetical protein